MNGELTKKKRGMPHKNNSVFRPANQEHWVDCVENSTRSFFPDIHPYAKFHPNDPAVSEEINANVFQHQRDAHKLREKNVYVGLSKRKLTAETMKSTAIVVVAAAAAHTHRNIGSWNVPKPRQHEWTFLVTRTRAVGCTNGRTRKGGADVAAHPVGQPCQPTRPLSTTTTTTAAAAAAAAASFVTDTSSINYNQCTIKEDEISLVFFIACRREAYPS